MTRKAPYQHPNGSGCWTKDCSRSRIPDSAPLQTDLKAINTSKQLDLAFTAGQLVPRNLDDMHANYYAATDQKHFGAKDEPGSKFLDPNLRKVEDVLILHMRQAGTSDLSGDDREELIARGSDPSGFRDSNRYLMVLTEGSVGMQHSEKLNPETKVEVLRTKPGVPCSLVLDVAHQGSTDFAVIVVGKHSMTGKDFVITTFPGPVTKPTSSQILDTYEGQKLTVAEVESLIGKDFWVNTRIPYTQTSRS